ncbi:hypothetical protein H0H93_016288, partial [Arthromyces matolae]
RINVDGRIVLVHGSIIRTESEVFGDALIPYDTDKVEISLLAERLEDVLFMFRVMYGKVNIEGPLTAAQISTGYRMFTRFKMHASLRERLEDGYYEDLTAKIPALGKTCLAEVAYNIDFKCIVDTYTGNHSFVTKNGGVFTINIFGQIDPISAGTIISAKGNHYMGRDGKKASHNSFTSSS